MEKLYMEKGGQRLRLGYTTGTCAAAAAKAAAAMLLSGRKIHQVRIVTPGGIALGLDIEDISFWQRDPFDGEYKKTQADAGDRITAVSCAVRKDSGDDPDVTDEALIYARVAYSGVPGIRIDGGHGVGRVTKPGLDQPVGEAAINSTPRRMIRQAVLEAWQLRQETCSGRHKGDRPESGPPAGAACPGFDVIISVPAGQELAPKTFNPKLGIVGGISILGTSGIVEPMSDEALLAAIRVEINVRKEEGLTILPAAPGNYGRNFFLEKYGFSLDTAVESSNFIYDTVKMAQNAGFRRMLFVGHIGKLVKVAGGIRNTHSRYGDHRMEILGQIAEEILREKAAGNMPVPENKPDAGRVSRPENEPPAGLISHPETDLDFEIISGSEGLRRAETISSLKQELAGCVSTDEAVRILKHYWTDGGRPKASLTGTGQGGQGAGTGGQRLDEPVLAEMTRRIQAVMQEWADHTMQVEVVVFSNLLGELGKTEGAEAFMEELRTGLS